MIFVVASLVVFFFVKPTINKREEYQTLNGDDSKPVPQEEEETSMLDRIPSKTKYLFITMITNNYICVFS